MLLHNPFNNPKVLLPVIHVRDTAQALRNVAIAHAAGCDGVFLINHENAAGVRELSFRDLLAIQATVATHFPTYWIGVNCLDLAAAEVFQHLTATVSGVWVDNGEIDERQEQQPTAQKILTAKQQSNWQGIYFAGVAFKYQRPVDDAAHAAQIATNYIDVVTTSGTATGKSAPIAKIARMKQAIGEQPLAIASGITPENIGNYLPHADIFLVATGISHSFYELAADKVNQLATLIHNS